MSLSVGRARLLKAGIRIAVGTAAHPGQLQLVRSYYPVAGPPRFPMSMTKRLILGWGSLLGMMIIPFWSLMQVPRWSAIHNGRPLPGEEDDSDNEETHEKKVKEMKNNT